MVVKKIKKVKTEQKEINKNSNFSLFSFDTHKTNFDLQWIKQANIIPNLQILFNVLFIVEMVFAQMMGTLELNTEQAMQSEIHKTLAMATSNAEMFQFYGFIVIEETLVYSQKVLNSEMLERFRELMKAKRTKSKFKKVTPNSKMTDSSLLSYCVGYIHSLKGKISTHPIYYVSKLMEHYGITDITKISLNDLKNMTPFPDQFQEGINYLSKTIKNANPHEEMSINDSTPLLNELGYEFNNLYIKDSQDIIEVENEEDFTEEELI